MLAAIVLMGIASSYNYWQKEGINNLLTSYQNLLINIGSLIEIEGRQGEIIGVSENGELRVRLFAAGDNPSSEISLLPGTISLGYG